MHRLNRSALLRNILLFVSCCLVLTTAFAHGNSRQCTFNGDCVEPLACEGGYCRVQCMTDRDCSGGWICRNATPGRAVSAPLTTDAYRGAAARDRSGRPIVPPTVVLADGPSVEVVGELRWNQCMPPSGNVNVPSAAVAAATAPSSAGPAPGYAMPVGRVDAAAASGDRGLKFWVDADGALWFAEGGSASERLGGVLKSEPSTVVVGDRIEAFFLGSDGAAWSIARIAGRWTGMYSLGGVLTSAPIARSTGKGDDLVVGASGADGSPYEIRREAGTWTAWTLAK